jgi:uncharacterized protein YndB with AHSA1/START domain
MKSQPIIVEQTYKAPIEKVWKAITDKKQMKEWYFNLDKFEPEAGFEFQFAGEGRKGEKYLHHCKITEVIPQQKLQYSWVYEGHDGYSVVTFNLSPEPGQTKLQLIHEGVETFPDSPDFARESFIEGWTYITGTSLKNFLENKNAG